MNLVTILGSRTKAVIAPSVGGAVFSLDAEGPIGSVPMLRKSSAGCSQPFDFASNVLSPFSNRISGGGFDFDGLFEQMFPDRPGQDMPIHGDAFHRELSVSHIRNDELFLTMNEGHIRGYRYDAETKFHVDGNTFRQETTLTNTGRRLPFGGGFHPFFPALPDTTLQFQADGIWLADDRRIPTRLVPTRDHPEWDFGRAKALPSTLLDNAYTDWTGRAEITQPTLGIVVRVTASTNLSTAVAFVPFPKRPFFCFEPVMHPNDAVNLPGMPGMKVLDTGESISFAMEIVWLPLI